MKIIGGNFGVGGKASVKGGILQLDTAKGIYTFDQSEVLAVSTSVSSEKQFGCIVFIFFAVLFSFIFGLFLSVLGVVIGVILAVAISWYTVESYEATIDVIDNKKVMVICSKREAGIVSALA